jgi:hypothetical protein
MNVNNLLRKPQVREFKNQIGFLTIAQNTDVDYLHLAYLQAKNIKQTQKYNQYAVIVDKETLKSVTDEHKTVFDYVIELPVDYAEDSQWKLNNEWQVFNLTPFKETIKLESDLLFTRDVSHWLYALRLRDVCLSVNCKNYQGDTVIENIYRRTFEVNNLPNVYNGLMYFRYSQTAADFFQLAKTIFENWHTVSQELAQCEESQPSTDLVYAVTAKIVGEELCTIPTLDWFNFVHMKSNIQGWNDHQPWTDYVNVEYEDTMIRINNVNQYNPIHYYEKNFVDAS